MGEISKSTSHLRAWNIALRTGHITVAGVLFGGHVFAIGAERLLPWLYLTIGTGSLLLILEAYPSWRWCYQGRGAMVLTKLILTCLVAWFWEYRVALLIGVIVLGSVASHMPRRFRYCSLLEIVRRRPTGPPESEPVSHHPFP